MALIVTDFCPCDPKRLIIPNVWGKQKLLVITTKQNMEIYHIESVWPIFSSFYLSMNICVLINAEFSDCLLYS